MELAVAVGTYSLSQLNQKSVEGMTKSNFCEKFGSF